MKDQGSITVWILGLVVALLFIGGISVDLWRVLAEKRELSALADSASIAAASGINEAALRTEGVVTLDTIGARSRAQRLLAGHDLTAASVVVAADGLSVTVSVANEVDLTLLAILAANAGPFQVEATATAGPRVSP